jgi:hypothetical protein
MSLSVRVRRKRKKNRKRWKKKKWPVLSLASPNPSRNSGSQGVDFLEAAASLASSKVFLVRLSICPIPPASRQG